MRSKDSMKRWLHLLKNVTYLSFILLIVLERRRDKNSKTDEKWIETVIHQGTSSDKTAAFIVQVQENPIFRLNLLSPLFNMASKKGRREAMMSVISLKDLFLSILPDRKLL
jgi:hypothetical protein